MTVLSSPIRPHVTAAKVYLKGMFASNKAKHAALSEHAKLLNYLFKYFQLKMNRSTRKLLTHPSF